MRWGNAEEKIMKILNYFYVLTETVIFIESRKGPGIVNYPYSFIIYIYMEITYCSNEFSARRK